MKFGAVPVEEAEGAVLAHSLEATDRPYEMQLVYRIPKGTVLTKNHVADLAEEGHVVVTVARLEPSDLDENMAADRIARALIDGHSDLRVSRAATGRVNIYAEGAGLLNLDAAAIHAVNSIDPMITVATLHPLQRVAAGTMVATIKIIAYGVAGRAVDEAVKMGGGAISIHAPVFASATLLETSLKPEPPAVKGREALALRLGRFAVQLTDRVVVPHQTEALAEAIQSATGEVVFVLTASATSDIRDTAPAAVVAAGGTVAHFGMPVDPGNLLFLGEVAGKPVIGLPGCARSPALNGADWVLERVICGLPVTSADIAAMGVGGLLKEIPTRPHPRDKAR